MHYSLRNILYLVPMLCLAIIPLQMHAQDELMRQLQEISPDNERLPVIATYKGSRLINSQTNETIKKKNLDARIHHLFGNMGTESGGGKHTLWGFDQSDDIQLALHYGITDRLMIGIARNKRMENISGLVKFRLLEQTTDGHVPVAITLYGTAACSAITKELIDYPDDRYTYSAQAIFARKFTSNISVSLIPAMVHRNAVPAGDQNTTFSLGGGIRWKFTKSASVVADYFHTFGRDEWTGTFTDPLGIGFEVETGGHTFTLMFTNASGILESDFLVNTNDKWQDGGFSFSFIISRMFEIGKKHH